MNGEFHGVGSLNYENGNYLYGNFRNAKPTGLILNYSAVNHDWFIIDESLGRCLQEDKGFPPPTLDGHKIVIEDIVMDNTIFKDKDFDYNALSIPTNN